MDEVGIATYTLPDDVAAALPIFTEPVRLAREDGKSIGALIKIDSFYLLLATALLAKNGSHIIPSDETDAPLLTFKDVFQNPGSFSAS